MKKVAYFPHQPSGCYWYRTEHAIKALESAGIPNDIIHLDDDIAIDNVGSFHFYGATPFSLRKIFDYLKEQHIKIVYDIDDVLDLIDETNPFYYAVKKDVGSFHEALSYADEITVSTPIIKEAIRKLTSAPITVIPNFYIPEEWNHTRINHNDIRIGFAGSSTHTSDLIDIIPAIQKLQARHNVTFYIMGFGQNTYEQWFRDFRYTVTEKGKQDLQELDRRLKEIKFEWIPFVNYKLFPKVLTELSLDIGICPLKSTPFNLCRGACKAMEYTLSGALALASDVAPYQEDKNSILVKDTDWLETLEHFILNEKERSAVLNGHLKWTEDHRSMNSQTDILRKVYVIE